MRLFQMIAAGSFALAMIAAAMLLPQACDAARQDCQRTSSVTCQWCAPADSPSWCWHISRVNTAVRSMNTSA